LSLETIKTKREFVYKSPFFPFLFIGNYFEFVLVAQCVRIGFVQKKKQFVFLNCIKKNKLQSQNCLELQFISFSKINILIKTNALALIEAVSFFKRFFHRFKKDTSG
jgi:hypothetical protein